MYASHRDACILSKYASDLTALLDAHYVASQLETYVIAYRQLGRANYDFAADAYKFALRKSPCVVMCFDVTGFFDNRITASTMPRNTPITIARIVSSIVVTIPRRTIGLNR